MEEEYPICEGYGHGCKQVYHAEQELIAMREKINELNESHRRELIDKAEEQYQTLKAENDRLREALEYIKDSGHHRNCRAMRNVGYCDCHNGVAKQALEDKC